VVRDDALHRGDHIRVIEWLGDVVNGPHTHGVDSRAQARITGHDEYRNVTRLANQVGTGCAGQAQVADDQVEFLEILAGLGFLHRAGLPDLVTIALQQAAEGGPDDRFVFDYEDFVHEVLPVV
jgi:hypothetical protein